MQQAIFLHLGGVMDGNSGLVRTSPQRYWNLKLAFGYATIKTVSSDLIQLLLGHAIVVLVLNRAGISVFRSLYDFAGRGFSRMMLWECARRECRIFAGLLPLLVCNMKALWSTTITCTDASPSGFGICEREL